MSMYYPTYKGTGRRVVPEQIDLLPRRVRRQIERDRISIDCSSGGKTQQAHADSCDINKIIARFERDGVMPPGRPGGFYADVTGFNGDLNELLIRSSETFSTAGEFLVGRKAELEQARQLAEKQEAVNPAETATTETTETQ